MGLRPNPNPSPNPNPHPNPNPNPNRNPNPNPIPNQVLRDEWGFGGLVVSDWLGTNERVRACEHGLTLTLTLTLT